MKSATTAPRRGPLSAVLEIAAFPLRGAAANFSAFVILVVFFAGGFTYAWQRWGSIVQNHPRYAIGLEQLQISPQPEWIQANVKEEVIRDGNLGALHSLDPQVTLKVAREFGFHPWVAEVKRVRKEFPARISVELDYRRPVAMVEVVTNGQRGLLPVDARGFLLPPQDFSAEQTREYLRVAVGDTLPAGSPGTSWGDPDVAAAAAVAAALSDTWRAGRLYRVMPLQDTGTNTGRNVDRQFVVVTRDGFQIIWGHAPGQEANLEASANEKAARLARYIEQRGGLTPLADQTSLDLRDPGGISAASLPSLPRRF